MKDTNGFMELGDLFYRVLSKYITSERIPKDFGIGQKLHPSEIHTIHAIGKNPGINVTELAKFLGITKGAVPKMIKKLRSKGLVEPFETINNRKEVHLRLTAEGKKAQKGYRRYHERRNALLKKYYNSLSKKDIEIITKTLQELGRYADLILKA
jgi:DNA-binding MarR family transcriptional regulator